MEWEILDPREARYVLTRPEEFFADLTLLRHRYQELADAPPWEDGLRFPDRVQINDLLAFNRAYRKHIADRRPLDLAHGWQLEAVLRETDQLYTIWETVKDARGECYYVTIRRQALKKLRECSVRKRITVAGCLLACRCGAFSRSTDIFLQQPRNHTSPTRQRGFPSLARRAGVRAFLPSTLWGTFPTCPLGSGTLETCPTVSPTQGY